MTADIELLKKITHGAVSIEKNYDGYYFYRMTEAQMEVCRNTAADFYEKAHATSGVRFDFVTDADSFEIKGMFRIGSSRLYAYFDVKINGIASQHTGTENYKENPDFAMTVNLDGKKNKISVYFPCLTQFILTELTFENASFVDPVKKDMTVICWGDSITQGYDAHFPSFAYPNQLSDLLNAEMYNKAIGAEVFNPDYFNEKEPLDADLITVAYGTNDWNKCSAETFKCNAPLFFEKLTAHYPDTPIYVIIPLWRKDCDRITAVGTFAEAREKLMQICSSYKNITIIDGWELLPHLEEFFADKYLHPNDMGFLHMMNKLLQYIPHP